MSITISNQAQAMMAARETAPTQPRQAAAVAAAQATPATDKVTLGASKQAPATYADPRSKVAMTAADLSAMLEASDRKAQDVLDLILPLLLQQGLNLAKVVSGEQTLNADPATIAKAKAAIADDGEFGVQQVADRILNFAKGVIGDDPSKLEAVRAAVQDGFDEAAKIMGGKLPDISQKTYAAIMASFDQWQSQGMDAPPASAIPAAKAGNSAV
jgi:uncharacterized lipoprotein NlpE involved in copper resistance